MEQTVRERSLLSRVALMLMVVPVIYPLQRNHLIAISGQLVGLAASGVSQSLVIGGAAQVGGLQDAKLEEVNH